MFPRSDLSRGRLAADGPCADEIVFVPCVPLAQSAFQVLCSCTLGAYVCINRYPSPSGRPDLFGVRPFSHHWFRRTLADGARRVELSFPVFVRVCIFARTRNLIGGGATQCSNSNFWPEWSFLRPLQAACRAMATASTPTARSWALLVVRPLVQLPKTTLPEVPWLAAPLALSRAIKVCATDLTSLCASLRKRDTTMTSHRGHRTPVAFSFA